MKLDDLYDFLTEGAFKDHRTGGDKCFNYMTNNFKIYIAIITLPIHLYIFTSLLMKLTSKLKSKKIYYPSVFERTLGILSIILLISQAVVKIMSKQLLFSLNPCHLVLFIQAYVLLNKNTLMNRVIGILSFNTLYSPVFALLFPHTEGQSQYEIYVYYIEHILSAFLNPVAMLLCNRFNEDCTSDIESNILSSILLIIYTRSVLTSISVLTKVNLNYTLCPAFDDPLAQFVGKWYYLFSESYFHLGSVLFPRIVHVATKYMILDRLKPKTE